MADKMSSVRVEAFFAALAETGNQTISAERARVSRSWVVSRQKRDPEFRARMYACITQAEARLLALHVATPPRHWDAEGGEALVIRGCGRRRAQVARVKLNQWSPAMEARFLTHLAASCNVERAAQAIGVSRESAYARRARWQGFAERWQEALEIGYIRLEFVLIENACNMLERIEPDLDAPIPPMTVDQVLLYLSLHRKTVHPNEWKRKPWRKKPVDMDALGEEIIRKLGVIRAHDAMGDPDARVREMLER